jgi:Peptidase_G2, IMC autoproteolytic cleavage domain
MKRQSRRQALSISRNCTSVIILIILCACSRNVLAQWTQPDGNGNINSTNTGNVGVGTTAPGTKLTVSTNTQTAPAGLTGTTMQVVGANGVTPRILIDAFGPVGSSLDLRKANNTALSPTAVGNNEIIGQITWQGRGATSYNGSSRAKIIVSAAETYTDTAQGAFMMFHVAPRGGLTAVEAMRIDATGFVGLGTPTPGFRLDVQSGQINASGGLCIASVCKTDWSQVGNTQWANGSGFINYTSGYVGIGTPTPSSAYKLDVQGGTINASGGLCIAGVCKSDWSQVGASQWTTTGASQIYYNTGNVGVGTNNPTSKLFVGSGTPAVQTLPGLNVALGSASYVSASNGTENMFMGADGSGYGVVGTLSNHGVGIRTNNIERVRIDTAGNVGLGTQTPSERLDINGNLKVAGTGTGNITASGTITGGNIQAKYQDVAEWVESSQKLNAGTVVILDSNKSNQVIASNCSYDSRVAGVISLQPGITLGEHAEGRVLVATTGRVKVKVAASNGPINIGDLLVSSDKTGVAMKSQPVEIGGVRIHRPGTLIGKALEPLASGTGEILVLLSLQ